MKKAFVFNWLRIVLACVVLAAFAACQGGNQGGGKIQWTRDYAQGLQLAKSHGKPVMLFFSATWCGYCRKLIQEVYEDDAVATEAKRLENIWVDIDSDRKTPEAYGIRGVPSVFFLDPDGQILMHYTGPRTPEHFARVMAAVADKFAKAS